MFIKIKGTSKKAACKTQRDTLREAKAWESLVVSVRRKYSNFSRAGNGSKGSSPVSGVELPLFPGAGNEVQGCCLWSLVEDNWPRSVGGRAAHVAAEFERLQELQLGSFS